MSGVLPTEYEITIEEVIESPRDCDQKVISSSVTHMSANSLSNSQSSIDDVLAMDVISDCGDISNMPKDQTSTSHKHVNNQKSIPFNKKHWTKQHAITWTLVTFFISIYLMILGGTVLYCSLAINSVSSNFVYFNEKFESACDLRNTNLQYKHPTDNMTLVKTCFSQQVIEINANKETYQNMDKLTIFYNSPTTFDIYYFKEMSSFDRYNTSYYLDPYSVNYWITTSTQYGFKQFSLSTVDNSTEIEENQKYGIRILFQVNLVSLTKLSNTSEVVGWDYLSTISESSLENYQTYNSTSFPFTISGSYYVESAASEITWLMIGVVLIVSFCLLSTLAIAMRFQRVIYAGDITTFLPASIRKITIDLLDKKRKAIKEDQNISIKTNIYPIQTGARIRYEKLNFKDFSGNTHLYETTGEFLPKTFTAILGESGSGKTTFINTLSKRARGKMGGIVFIGNKQLKSDSIKRLIGFVPQDDTMIPTLTPRETLLFNSFVRNEGLDMDGHKHIVDKVLRDLKLVKEGYDASNTIIGNEEHRGISGGEKKRVNVGIELVTQPSVLILDEPTTGLDYLTANKTCKILQEIANGGKTVLCVIHQPAYETFCLFTDVMVFKTKQVVLKGKRKIVCNEIGKILKSKRGINADEILDYVSGASLEELTQLQLRIESIQEEISSISDIEPYSTMDNQLARSNENPNNHNKVNDQKVKPKDVSPFYKQFIALLIRSLIQLKRGWMNIIFDALLSILGGILLGLLFLNQAGNLYEGPVAKGIVYTCPTDKISICALPQKDYVTALASLLIFGCSLTAAMSSLRVFGNEKANFIRETLNGVNSFMYYIVKDMLANLQILIVSFFFSLSFYFIVLPRGGFGFYFGTMFLLSFITFPIAYCISIVVSPQLRQITCATIIFLAYMFCGGVPTLTDMNEMPQPLPMFPIFSHARYVRELLFVGEMVNYEDDYFIAKSFSLYSYQEDHEIYLVLVCLCFSITFRVLAYCLLWQSTPTSTLTRFHSKVKSIGSKLISPFERIRNWIANMVKMKLQQVFDNDLA